MEKKNKKIINILTVLIIAILISVFFLASKKGEEKGMVIAKINGNNIYENEIQTFINNLLNSRVPLNFVDLTTEQKQGILKQYGVERAIYKQAKNSNVKKDPEVKKKIAEFKKSAIKEAYLNKIADKNITQAAIEEKYQEKLPELRNKVKGEKEYHASHILTSSIAEANKVKLELKTKDFATVAKEYSLDEGSKIRGGDLGYFTTDKMISEFSDQVIALAPGEISAPFKTNFGWHIVKLHDSRAVQVPALNEVQYEIRKEIYYKTLENYVSEIGQNINVELVNSN